MCFSGKNTKKGQVEEAMVAMQAQIEAERANFQKQQTSNRSPTQSVSHRAQVSTNYCT